MILLAKYRLRARKVARWRFAIATLVLAGMLFSAARAWAQDPPLPLPLPPPTQTVITPNSPEGQSIANAANLLEMLGEPAVAQRIRDRLNAGQYSYDHLDGNAETRTGSQHTTINVGTIWVVDLPAYRGVTLDPVKNFSELFSLARTLFHEDIHSGQSYFAGLYQLSPWEQKHETEAWSNTIAAMASWIRNASAQHTLTPEQLAIMARNLSSYISSWGELNFHGLDASAIAAFRNIAAEMDGLAQRFDTMAAQSAPGASSNASNPPVSNPPGGSTTPGGPATPKPPTPQPPTPPTPKTPAEVCPECIIYLQAVIELRNELAQALAQVAAQNASIANNQIAQRAAQAKIAALQAALAGQQGIGGSGYDPSTGLTRQAVTQADGTVLVTVTDANGNILEQSVRNRSDLASVQRDLSAAQAQLESLKTEGAALAKERDRLVAREQVLAARLQDAIQQLADCLEKKCSHLIGQRLNTIAEQFGLDPLTGKPAPPKATGNTQTGNVGSSNAANAAERAAENAANKANETKVSTPSMQNGAGAGNVKPSNGALPGGGAGDSGNNNNGGNNNGADNGANNGNAGDNPPPPQPPAANPQPAAEKRPPDYKHAQPFTDPNTGGIVPYQYTVTICEGDDYVFPIGGGEVDVKNVKATPINPTQPPDATAVGFGNGIRIFGKHVGANPIDADVVRPDGSEAVHIRILVTVIDCSHRTAVVQPNGPGAKPNAPVDNAGGGGDENAIPLGGEGENGNPPLGGDNGDPYKGSFDVFDEANSTLYGNALDAPAVQNVVITLNINIGGAAPDGSTTTSGSLQSPSHRFVAANHPLGTRTPFKLAAYHSGSPSRAPAAERVVADRGSAKFLPPLSSTEGLSFSIVSKGNLGTGALEFQVRDPSGKLKGKLSLPEGMVLQPLRPGTRNPVTPAGRGTSPAQQLTAYCLDMAKLPPEPGQLYRLAPRAVQQRYRPLRAVLQAGARLGAAGKFHPDSEANAYADFVRQHALWAELEHWTEQKFTEVFLERTRKNAEHMNVKWTKEMEDTLRAAAPGRWRDIALVLDEAHKPAGARQGVR